MPHHEAENDLPVPDGLGGEDVWPDPVVGETIVSTMTTVTLIRMITKATRICPWSRASVGRLGSLQETESAHSGTESAEESRERGENREFAPRGRMVHPGSLSTLRSQQR
jgi:hypothetical protein